MHARESGMLMLRTVVFSGLAVLLSACGGKSEEVSQVAPAEAATPKPVAVQVDDELSEIRAVLDRFPVKDAAILIGDETGLKHTYAKGELLPGYPLAIASGSKLIFGAALWKLVNAGDMSPDDHPQDYLSYWSADDPRGEVTLSDLMSLTSGFNDTREATGCIADTRTNLSDCVRQIYEYGLQAQPGETFSYGLNHLQIAAAMMAQASSATPPDAIQSLIFDPLEMGWATEFPDAYLDNSAYAASMVTSPEDYGRFLTALLAGDLISDMDGFLKVRAGKDVPGNRWNGWEYGWGFWIECTPETSEDCTAPLISSPGALGFLPWVDFAEGYWAVIAMQEEPSGRYEPVKASIELEQELQPLIAELMNSDHS